jgi:DNA (cytosine-5)-methyltransferase 1
MKSNRDTGGTAESARDYERFWKPQSSRKVARTSIDLFSGSGGLSLGLHTLGWKGLFAVEKDPMAFDTLATNFLDDRSPFRSFRDWPEWLPKEPTDIVALLEDDAKRKLLGKMKGTVDLVAGGPPCQGFSVGGARRGEKDPRNDLPFRFVDFVETVRPRTLMLENVEGFDKPFAHQGHLESYADVVAEEFRSLGYTVIKSLLHAVRFGVPQTRRRVVLFGVRDDGGRGVSESELRLVFEHLLDEYADNFASEWLNDTSLPVGVEAAIHDLSGSRLVQSPDAPRFKTAHYRKARSNYAKLMRAFVDGPIPDSHRIPVHTEKVDQLIRAAQATRKPGRLPQMFLREMGTRSRKKVLLDPDAPASTLTSHPDEFFHYELPRIITLRESARLQSFPDAFVFKGRYTLNGDRRGLDVSRCAQVGNAIPPLLGRAIGAVISRILDEMDTGTIQSLVDTAHESSGQLFVS